MGSPAPLRKPLSTLTGLAPRASMETAPCAYGLDEPFSIDVEIEDRTPITEPPISAVRKKLPAQPPRMTPVPIALPTVEEIREIARRARLERMQGTALAVLTALVVLALTYWLLSSSI